MSTQTKKQVEDALRAFQEETGLDFGGANLYPGTAARIAAEVYEPLLDKVLALTEKHPTYPDTNLPILVGDQVTATRQGETHTGPVTGVFKGSVYIQVSSGMCIEVYAENVRLT